jgi:hypothetical protein
MTHVQVLPLAMLLLAAVPLRDSVVAPAVSSHLEQQDACCSTMEHVAHLICLHRLAVAQIRQSTEPLP